MLPHHFLVLHRDEITHIVVREYVEMQEQFIHILLEALFPFFNNLVLEAFEFLRWKLRKLR